VTEVVFIIARFSAAPCITGIEPSGFATSALV